MMNLQRLAATLLFSASAFAIVSSTASAQPTPGHVDEVLHQLDIASTKFRSAEADFKWDFYERVVKQTTTQNGTIYFLKDGTKTQMGAKIAPPSSRYLEYKDGQLKVFDPGSDHLTLLNAGGNQAQYESFLTLGFGGRGSDLAKAWNITEIGSETLNDGTKSVETVKLDLVSKDQGVRNMFTHIVIWVDPERGISLKQQFFTPSEDQRTAIYTHIRYNQKVDTAPYTIKTDKKTTVDHH